MKVDHCDQQRQECRSCLVEWVHGDCEECILEPDGRHDFHHYFACWKALRCFDCGDGNRCKLN